MDEAQQYLYEATSNLWNTSPVDVTGGKLDVNFWAWILKDFEHYQVLRANKIIYSNKLWLKEAFSQCTQHNTIVEDKTFEKPGHLGSLYGVDVYVDEKVPANMAILCSQDTTMKAVVLVNNDWKPRVTQTISKYQWIHKQIKEDENEMQNA